MAPNEVEIAENYGFKKVVTVLELLTLYPTASPVGLYDFFMSEELFQKVHKGLLARYKMTADELKAELRFDAIIVIHATLRALSFIQVVLDIASTTDGTLLGEKRDSSTEPQTVKIFTTDADLLWSD